MKVILLILITILFSNSIEAQSPILTQPNFQRSHLEPAIPTTPIIPKELDIRDLKHREPDTSGHNPVDPNQGGFQSNQSTSVPSPVTAPWYGPRPETPSFNQPTWEVDRPSSNEWNSQDPLFQLKRQLAELNQKLEESSPIVHEVVQLLEQKRIVENKLDVLEQEGIDTQRAGDLEESKLDKTDPDIQQAANLIEDRELILRKLRGIERRGFPVREVARDMHQRTEILRILNRY